MAPAWTPNGVAPVSDIFGHAACLRRRTLRAATECTLSALVGKSVSVATTSNISITGAPRDHALRACPKDKTNACGALSRIVVAGMLLMLLALRG